MTSPELREKARRILCVSDKAGIKEIKHAYWDLAKKYHPDLNGGDGSLAGKFKLISEAYEILMGGKNDDRCSVFKDEVWAQDSRPFKDEKSYWQWWKERYGDLI